MPEHGADGEKSAHGLAGVDAAFNVGAHDAGRSFGTQGHGTALAVGNAVHLLLHHAQAYGRECCMRGLKTYYIKATELRDRFQKAVQRGNTSRAVASIISKRRLCAGNWSAKPLIA